MTDGTRDDADRGADDPEEARTPDATSDELRDAGTDEPGEDDVGEGSLDDVDVRDLLRGALRPPPGSVAPELLGGVQRKLRQRSRGKFYGDGWSTAHAPRSTYLVTSAIMLALIVVIAALLIPWEAVGL